MDFRRSLVNHSPLRRRPEVMLRRMLDRVSADTTVTEPVAELEQRVAELLGKPRALFFPTGTMAQQVALRIHAERTGRPAFTAHRTNHLDLWEQRGYAVVHGLRYVPVGDAHRLLTLEDLTAVGERPGTLLLELPQREIGGDLPAWDDLTAQLDWARRHGAATHLDGARLWEAQPFYDRPHAEIAGLFDTVYVSLYKGLEGIRGGLLAGEDDLIAEAEVWRQRLGGAVPDAWPLALAGLVGLDEQLDRMPAFRDHAVAVAAAISADGTAAVVPDPPRTPLFHIHLPVPPYAARRANREMVEEHGVQVLTYVQSQPLPDRCAFEITVGENAMAFSPEEFVELLRELVERACS
ncbi:threonine aldolase family protein [Actinophytocola xanthii]|uniref:Threonine aldolase n=1 Tax=Actinophytocola xanthii TaxID=1912961 RepID=A0A1Q8C0R4_9PSEU|nr:beta-eliminating lyase-related protein [Actinophytocola xanthii]OLF07947.1 threonine aldolase [Actinophytocola xanthii]